MKWFLSGILVLLCSSYVHASNNTTYDVSGFVDFEVGKTEFKSCVARTEDNSIKISVYPFDLSKDDINAYRKAYNVNKYNRPIKEMEADERHPIAKGYKRHPQIYIAVDFESLKNFDIRLLNKISVGFGGGGKDGGLFIGLHPGNFSAEIDALNRYSISGQILPNKVKMSFRVRFTCPILN